MQLKIDLLLGFLRLRDVGMSLCFSLALSLTNVTLAVDGATRPHGFVLHREFFDCFQNRKIFDHLGTLVTNYFRRIAFVIVHLDPRIASVSMFDVH